MFNPIIVDNFCKPEYQGDMINPSTILSLGNPVCGDKVDIFIKFNEQDKISQACFQAWGCSTSLAMSNIFCRYIEGKTLFEIGNISNREMEDLLGELSPSQKHCFDMLKNLFNQLKGKI